MAENEKVTAEKTTNSKPKAARAALAEPSKPGFDWTSLNSLVAVITGHIALAQLKTSGESGRKLALIGVVLGYVQLVVILLFSVLAVIAQVALFSLLGSEPGIWMNFVDMRNGMRFDWG
jgi:hypothetical protein